jgi:hypothetical protein
LTKTGTFINQLKQQKQLDKSIKELLSSSDSENSEYSVISVLESKEDELLSEESEKDLNKTRFERVPSQFLKKKKLRLKNDSRLIQYIAENFYELPKSYASLVEKFGALERVVKRLWSKGRRLTFRKVREIVIYKAKM